MEKTLETQLLEFQKKISVISKDAKNPHFKNTYASLKQILSEVKPVLNEVGILITQPINNNKVGTQLTFNGVILDSYIDLPTNMNPQQLGSAITYFRRYTLASLLSLEIDDDDAQMASKPVVKPSLTEQVETAKAKIITATTLEDLKAKWSTLNKIEQAFQEVIELKDKLKTTLK
jgi:hypothetical protein